MTPREIYNQLLSAIGSLNKIRSRDVFSANEQALIYICIDNLNEIKDLLISKLPPIVADP